MAKIAKQLTELIGHTPLLELTNYEKALGLEAKIIAKLEDFNPLGSVKDRVAAAMIEQGIKDGKINQDTIIIEPTSGNTGIGLAFVAASKGLHLILIMPDTMSVENCLWQGGWSCRYLTVYFFPLFGSFLCLNRSGIL